MADTTCEGKPTPEQVSLTLKIDAPVYEAFLRKAQLANMDVESFLSNTLTIVLGCRIFTKSDDTLPAPFAKLTNTDCR